MDGEPGLLPVTAAATGAIACGGIPTANDRVEVRRIDDLKHHVTLGHAQRIRFFARSLATKELSSPIEPAALKRKRSESRRVHLTASSGICDGW